MQIDLEIKIQLYSHVCIHRDEHTTFSKGGVERFGEIQL